MSNPLVATPESSTDWSTGSSELGDVKDTIDDIKDGNAVDAVFDVGGFALDILGDALDPLGAVIGCAVGWIVEHVSFLREPVDILAGDPASIEAAAQTWTNVAAALNNAASDYAKDVTSLTEDDWSGVARQLYNSKAQGINEMLQASAVAATVESGLITATGGLCAAFRAQIFNWIADFIEQACLRGLIALANSTWTFGATIAAWIIDVEVEGGLLAAKIAGKLSELFGKAAKICSKFAGDAKAFEKAAKLLEKASKSLAKSASEITKDLNKARTAAKSSTASAKDAENLLTKVGEAGDLLHLDAAGNVVTNTKDGVDLAMDPSGENLNTLIGDLSEQGSSSKLGGDDDEDGSSTSDPGPNSNSNSNPNSNSNSNSDPAPAPAP